MENKKKALTQSDDNENLYKEYITNLPTNNNNDYNTFNYNINNEYININNNSKPSKIKNINNISNKNNKVNKNYIKPQNINDEDTEFQSKINSLKAQIESKNIEIQNLNNKISLLIQQSEELKQENNILYEKNDIFYQSFISMINNFKSINNTKNIHFPNYSIEDEQDKKYKDILYTLEVLINIIIEFPKNTNNNDFKFSELKDKINLVNKTYIEKTKDKNNEVNKLKKQLIKMKNILEKNSDF